MLGGKKTRADKGVSAIAINWARTKFVPENIGINESIFIFLLWNSMLHYRRPSAGLVSTWYRFSSKRRLWPVHFVKLSIFIVYVFTRFPNDSVARYCVKLYYQCMAVCVCLPVQESSIQGHWPLWRPSSGLFDGLRLTIAFLLAFPWLSCGRLIDFLSPSRKSFDGSPVRLLMAFLWRFYGLLLDFGWPICGL